tara:strand:+ start:727 stop:969 length:243 start_codon:yes stop_codon:yes gene_type:complete
MRNSPLKAFVTPLKQNESVSDSVNRPKGQEITILPKKKETYNPGKNAPKPGKIYSKSDQQLKAMQQTNPLARLFTGIKPG